MTNDQTDKLKMLWDTAFFFEKEAAVFNPLPQFPPLINELKLQTREIENQEMISTGNMTGYTEAKNQTRQTLVNLLKKVSDSLLSYGQNNSAPYIIEREDYLAGRLSDASDSEVYVLAVQLFRKADPVKASLPPYGSNPADVVLLQTTADSFVDQIRVPFANRKARSRAVAQVKKLFAQCDEVLQTLDIHMAVYEYININLYLRYRSARNIDNLSGGHTVHKKRGRVLPGFVAYAPFTAAALKGVKKFIFYNEGKKGDLQFYFSAHPRERAQAGTTLTTLNGDSRIEIAVAQSGYSAATPYLNIHNPNAFAGKWKAEVKRD